jgi:proteic killer suppression protein
VIQSFADEQTKKVWERAHVRSFGPDLQRAAQKKLRLLNAADVLNDLRIPPGNRLEKLSGDREGQHSIRINDQYQICFVWTAAGPAEVQIVDYHCEERIMSKAHEPITPGEMLQTEFLEPLGITAYRLAQATGLPQTRLSEIIRGKRRITTDTALRLSQAFGLSERFWLNLQTDYDIELAHDENNPELGHVERLIPA